MKTPTLTGDRCKCSACGLLFNSTNAFDNHRRGSYGVDRRCLSPAELTAKRCAPNEAGFWRQPMQEPTKHKTA